LYIKYTIDKKALKGLGLCPRLFSCLPRMKKTDMGRGEAQRRVDM